MIVGRAMIASRMLPLMAFRPLPVWKILAMAGPNRTIPRKPTTTEGMPARISTTGLTISRTRQWATSERYAATPMPMGTARRRAPIVTMRVLTIMDRMPYSAFSGEVGSQFVFRRNSERWISLNAGTAVKRSVAKMPIRTRTARMPQVRKKALIADSLRFVHVLFFIPQPGPLSPCSNLCEGLGARQIT